MIKSTGFKYLKKDPTCNYTWVASTGGERVKNAVITLSEPNFYIGRYRRSPILFVGRVELKGTRNEFQRFGLESLHTSYEVLTCEPIQIVSPEHIHCKNSLRKAILKINELKLENSFLQKQLTRAG